MHDSSRRLHAPVRPRSLCAFTLAPASDQVYPWAISHLPSAVGRLAGAARPRLDCRLPACRWESPMTTQVSTAHALKEWAAVIDAMERGRQVITLRKGGIREKAFLVEAANFYLLPTF